MSPEASRFRQALIWTLALSVPALLGICVLVVGFRDGLRLAASCSIQAVFALAVMAVFGWLVAPSWGSACTRHLFLAGLFGIFIFLVGTVAGSTVSMLVYRDFSLFDYIVKPLFWLGIIGFVPAFIVGIIGALISRHLLRSQQAPNQVMQRTAPRSDA
jgi:hypothetical protein